LRDRILQANLELHGEEACIYDQVHAEIFNPVEQKRLARMVSLASSYCKSGGHRALDVGAGTGNLTRWLLELGYTTTAVDLSPEMLAALQRKFPEAVAAELLTVTISEAEHIPGKGEEYDFVGAYSVMHHLPDYMAAIREMVRVLKPGGVLYLDHEHRAMAPAELWRWRVYTRLRTVRMKSVLRAALLPLAGAKSGDDAASASRYWWADYWVTQGHGLDWERVAGLCAELGVREIPTRPYLNYRGTLRDRLLHPLFSRLVADTRTFIGVKDA